MIQEQTNGLPDSATEMVSRDAEIAELQRQIAERDAGDIQRSEDGRTDWDYEQRIARLQVKIAELQGENE